MRFSPENTIENVKLSLESRKNQTIGLDLIFQKGHLESKIGAFRKIDFRALKVKRK